MLPTVTQPIRLNDLPALLGPYARTAPVFVYMMSCGNLKATRFRLGDEEELMLVLAPHGTFAQTEASACPVLEPLEAPLAARLCPLQIFRTPRGFSRIAGRKQGNKW